MKKLFLVTAFITITLNLNAQTYIALEDTSSVYAKVDADPQFPGGFRMFDQYIDDNSVKVLKPDHALGAIVVSFYVEKDGKITKPKIINGLTPETDSTAIYLMENSPPWKPGIKNGLPVKTFAKIAVKFIYSGNLRPVHTQDVVVSKGQYADVMIDQPNPQNKVDPNKIYNMYERAPEFPGGSEKFELYLKQNFNLPPNSDGIKGKVILSFIVERDGSLTDIRVERGLSPDINKEAIRVINASPKWQPGIWNSKPVRIAFKVHIDVPINP